ncbi:hypothetical protein [Nocardia abscessus]|uniref:hypothetical protein n=1 Tax=Nocardia abscessus TaxID=120957 RepID=UPI0024585E3C|nr:hypothetical protein [Nocardia abscessus]
METWLAAVLDDEQRHRFDELVRYLGFAAVVLLAAGVLWILGFLGCAFRFSWPFIIFGVLLCVGLLGASYVYANLLLTGAGFAGLFVVAHGGSHGADAFQDSKYQARLRNTD